jgi:hypothetical protein
LIWRKALPRSETIDLGPGKVGRNHRGQVTGPIYRLPRIQHPVTLFVNVESRTETQKYYRIIFRNIVTDLSQPAKLSPLSFSVTRDTFQIKLFNAACSDTDWAGDLLQRNPGGLDGIKELQISDYLWSGGPGRSKSPRARLCESSPRDIAFRFFKDLEDVELFATKKLYKDEEDYEELVSGMGSQNVHDMPTYLQEYFVRQNEANGSYNVPSIRITDPQTDLTKQPRLEK